MDSNELNETLNFQQRIQRAQILRRNARKVERARELAKRRMADDTKLHKRALVQARDFFRRKVAGKRGEQYDTLSVPEKIAIDKLLDSKKNAIVKLATRLLPKVRQAEQERLHSFLHGSPLMNFGQPEGISKEPISLSEAKEKTKDKKDVKASEKEQPAQQTRRRIKNPFVTFYASFGEHKENDTPFYQLLEAMALESDIDVMILGEVFERYATSHESINEDEAADSVQRFVEAFKAGKYTIHEDLVEIAHAVNEAYEEFVSMSSKSTLNEEPSGGDFIAEPQEILRMFFATHPDAHGRIRRNRIREDEVRESASASFLYRAAHERILANPLVEDVRVTPSSYTVKLKAGWKYNSSNIIEAQNSREALSLVLEAQYEEPAPRVPLVKSKATVTGPGHYAVIGFDPKSVDSSKPSAHLIVINALNKNQVEHLAAQHLPNFELLSKHISNDSYGINEYKHVLESLYKKPVKVINAAAVDGRVYESNVGSVEPVLSESGDRIGWQSTSPQGETLYWTTKGYQSAVYHARLYEDYGIDQELMTKAAHVLVSIDRNGSYVTEKLDQAEKELLAKCPAFVRSSASMINEDTKEISVKHVIKQIDAKLLPESMSLWSEPATVYGVMMCKGIGPTAGCRLILKPSNNEGEVWRGNRFVGGIGFRNDRYIPDGSDEHFDSIQDAATHVATHGEGALAEEHEGNFEPDPSNREIGTDSLVQAFMYDTPGQIPDRMFLKYDAEGNPINEEQTPATMGPGHVRAHYRIRAMRDEEGIPTGEVRRTLVRAFPRRKPSKKPILNTGNVTDGQPGV